MRIRLPILIMLILLCQLAFANNDAMKSTYPKLKTRGRNITQFIPKGWHMLRKAEGDLNSDKLPDYAVVIQCNKNLNAQLGDEYNSEGNRHQPRIFFIVLTQKAGRGYTLSIQSNDLIKCNDVGGIFGDPFVHEGGITIEHGTVVVHHYGGSAWRWDIKARFRLQNSQWYLIGLTDLSYWNVNNEMTLYDYNLLTGKMSTTIGTYMDSKAKRTVTWTTPGKRKVLLTGYAVWCDNEWQQIADHG